MKVVATFISMGLLLAILLGVAVYFLWDDLMRYEESKTFCYDNNLEHKYYTKDNIYCEDSDGNIIKFDRVEVE